MLHTQSVRLGFIHVNLLSIPPIEIRAIIYPILGLHDFLQQNKYRPTCE